MIKLKAAFSLSLILCLSCNGSNTSKPLQVDAAKTNLSVHEGKTVKSIKYCDNCGHSGDILIVSFTDGSKLQVYAYKYNMKIYK